MAQEGSMDSKDTQQLLGTTESSNGPIVANGRAEEKGTGGEGTGDRAEVGASDKLALQTLRDREDVKESEENGAEDLASPGGRQGTTPAIPTYRLAVPPPDAAAPERGIQADLDAMGVEEEERVTWKQCKSGFLLKQGKRFKTWKRRFFLLSNKDKTLRYFSDAGGQGATGNRASTAFALPRFSKSPTQRGVITLTKGMTIVDKVQGKSKGFGFDLLTKERHYRFVADTAADRCHWVREISNVLFSVEHNTSGTLLPDEHILQELSCSFSMSGRITGGEAPRMATPASPAASPQTAPPATPPHKPSGSAKSASDGPKANHSSARRSRLRDIFTPTSTMVLSDAKAALEAASAQPRRYSARLSMSGAEHVAEAKETTSAGLVSNATPASLWVTSYRLLVRYEKHSEDLRQPVVAYVSVPIDSIADVRIELSDRLTGKLQAVPLDTSAVRQSAQVLVDMWMSAKDAAAAGWGALAAFSRYTLVLRCRDFRVLHLGFDRKHQSGTEHVVKCLLSLLDTKLLTPSHDLPRDCPDDVTSPRGMPPPRPSSEIEKQQADSRAAEFFYSEEKEVKRQGTGSSWKRSRVPFRPSSAKAGKQTTEAARQGRQGPQRKEQQQWELLQAEVGSELELQYRTAVVPRGAGEKQLERCARIRQEGGVPSLVWRHPKTSGLLLTASGFVENFVQSEQKKRTAAMAQARTPPMTHHHHSKRRTSSMSESDSQVYGMRKERSAPQFHADGNEKREREWAAAKEATSGLVHLITAEAPKKLLRIVRLVAPGAEEPSGQTHPRVSVTVVHLPPTSAIQSSFGQLYDLCTGSVVVMEQAPQSVMEEMEETQWMRHSRDFLHAAAATAKALDEGHSCCFESPMSEKYASKVLASLVMLILDPYYRTPEGFSVLVQREWCHLLLAGLKREQEEDLPASSSSAPTSPRVQRASESTVESSECGAPVREASEPIGVTKEEEGLVMVTLLFDCIWQLMQEAPRSFKFNNNFLVFLLESLTSGTFSFRASMCAMGSYDLTYVVATEKGAHLSAEDPGPPSCGSTSALFSSAASISNATAADNVWRLAARHHREFINPLFRQGRTSLRLDGFLSASVPENCWLPFFLRHSHLGSIVLARQEVQRATKARNPLLSLAYLGLPSVPTAVNSLAHLLVVDLSYNLLTTIPAELSLLPNLVELSLEGNFVHAIFSDDLLLPPTLTSLNLKFNRLASLPATLGSYTRLTGLYLAGNRLTTLPVQLANLTGLKTLDLAHNPLEALPDFVCELVCLEQISLNSTGLAVMPEKLCQLTRLRHLDVADNSDLQSAAWSMKARQTCTELRTLNISGNVHFDSSFYFAMPHLTALHLRELGLHKLPGNVAQLTDLFTLDLAGNDFTEFPTIILSLEKLERLNFSNNQLRSLPLDVASLSSLKSLNLHGNKLAPLDLYGVGMLTELRRLDVSANPRILAYCNSGDVPLANLGNLAHCLRQLRVEEGLWLVGEQLHAVLHRQEQLLNAEVVFQYLPRVMTVGPTNSGKSSLVKWLTSRFEADKKGGTASNKTLQFDFMAPTQGVAIKSQFVVLPEKRERKRVAAKTLMSTWDFGGHPQFRSSHQYFMADDAVYVLLFDYSRVREELVEVEAWLRFIYAKAPTAPVILVGTHVESMSPSAYAIALEQAQHLKDGLRKFCPSISAVYLVSCAPKSLRKACGISTAGTTAKKATKKMDTMTSGVTRQILGGQSQAGQLFELEQHLLSLMRNEQVPYTFTDFIFLLKRERMKRQPPIMTWDELEEMAASFNIRGPQYATVKELLVQWGFIVDFPSIITSGQFFSPKWLSDLLVTLHPSESATYRIPKGGVLSESVTDQCWRAPQYPKHTHQILFDTLQTMGVLHQICTNEIWLQCRLSAPRGMLRKVSDVDNPLALVPGLLYPTRPTSHIAEAQAGHSQLEVGASRLKFAPPGLFSQILVMLLSKPDVIPTLLWERGCLCTNGNELLLVDMILPDEVASFKDLNINVLASHEDIVAGNDGATYLRAEVHDLEENPEADLVLAQWFHHCQRFVMQQWYAAARLSEPEAKPLGASGAMLSVKAPDDDAA